MTRWIRLRLVTTPYSPIRTSQAATAYGRKPTLLAAYDDRLVEELGPQQHARARDLDGDGDVADRHRAAGKQRAGGADGEEVVEERAREHEPADADQREPGGATGLGHLDERVRRHPPERQVLAGEEGGEQGGGQHDAS